MKTKEFHRVTEQGAEFRPPGSRPVGWMVLTALCLLPVYLFLTGHRRDGRLFLAACAGGLVAVLVSLANKVKEKSDMCNCQGNADNGCNNREGETRRNNRRAWVGVCLLIGAVHMYLFSGHDEPILLTLARPVELLGLVFFGVAMARWRG